MGYLSGSICLWKTMCPTYVSIDIPSEANLFSHIVLSDNLQHKSTWAVQQNLSIQFIALFAESDREHGVVNLNMEYGIPESSWKYWNFSNWVEDTTLRVEVVHPNISYTYPENLTISTSNEEAFKEQWDRYGVYRRLPGVEQFGKPVWKHVMVDQYLQFASEYQHYENTCSGI